MPSEYDFLSPYSRRLRRAGLAAIGLSAFLAGAVAMAAIVALPLFPLGGRDTAPATEAKAGAAQKPADDVTPPATKLSTSATASDKSTKNAPASPTPDTVAGRETTGRAGTSTTASSGGNPPDSKTAAPPASTYKDTSVVPPVPAAQSESSGGASAGEASAVPTNAGTSGQVADTTGAPTRAASGSEASPRAKKKSTASRTRRAHAERAARSRQREEYRAPWDYGERRAGRQFVDGNGVRYFVVPRSAESAFAYDDAPRTRRTFIMRPRGAFDDD